MPTPNRHPILPALLVLTLCSIALGSQEFVAVVTSLTFVCQPKEGFPETTAQVQTEGQGNERHIVLVRVSNKDFDVTVPREALVDLALPMLDTVCLITEPGHDKTPWMYVRFKLGNPKPNEEWDFPIVHLQIHDGKFVQRSLSRHIGNRSTFEILPLATQPATQPAPPKP